MREEKHESKTREIVGREKCFQAIIIGLREDTSKQFKILVHHLSWIVI